MLLLLIFGLVMVVMVTFISIIQHFRWVALKGRLGAVEHELHCAVFAKLQLSVLLCHNG